MVLLNFLINALTVMNLTVLSQVLEAGILFLPRIATAIAIFAVGWLIAGWVGGALRRAMIKEDVPRATLVSRFSKSVLILFFAAMALAELDVAREIVVIGFTTVIVTLGVLSIVFVARGGKNLVGRILDSIGNSGHPSAHVEGKKPRRRRD